LWDVFTGEGTSYREEESEDSGRGLVLQSSESRKGGGKRKKDLAERSLREERGPKSL